MEKKRFFVPQVPIANEQVDKQEEKKAKKISVEPFVSPVHGKNVKDELTFSGAQFGNSGRQYDAFREPEARVVKNDYQDYVTYNKQSDVKEDNKSTKDVSLKDPSINNSNYHPASNNYNRPSYNENDTKEPDYIDEIYENDDFVEEEVTQKKPVKEVFEKKVVSKPKKVGASKGEYLAPPLSLLRRSKPTVGSDMSAVHFQRERID